MANKYIPPEHGQEAFSCPHCDAYSAQEWRVSLRTENGGGVQISICQLCRTFAVWVGLVAERKFSENPAHTYKAVDWRLLYPSASLAPLPSEDMPKEIVEDYLEARAIVRVSPRGAAALLRLCIQKLMPHLGKKGKYLNDDIGELVQEKVLSPKIAKALDSVRVIGNESVHAGILDLRDEPEIANLLFDLVNIIVDLTLTSEKKIDLVHSKLPENKLDAITKRDDKLAAKNSN
ncbi:MAG: DUF4145 domain-containing protein [Anaerolineaceae bacterium]|nr:DUF4145 domain-containing protein [Anaerolineaceae bacterium]